MAHHRHEARPRGYPKLLPADSADDPQRHARFEREARTPGSLDHPDIADLRGLEDCDGQHVLVIELVEGEILDEVSDVPLITLPVDRRSLLRSH